MRDIPDQWVHRIRIDDANRKYGDDITTVENIMDTDIGEEKLSLIHI